MNKTVAFIGLITALLSLGGAYLGLVKESGGDSEPTTTQAAPASGPGNAVLPQTTPTTSVPPYTPPREPVTTEDPTDSAEYQDCSRNAGYDPSACEVLRDEATGEQARSFYADCRDSGYDTQSCLAAWQDQAP